MANDEGQPGPAPGAQPGATQPRQGDLVLKTPAENPNVRGHSPSRDHREAAAAGLDQQQPPQKFKIGDAEFSEDDVRAALADKAQRDSVKALAPATADGYEIKLPADYKAPEGFAKDHAIEFDLTNPALGIAKEFALKHGLDQAAFSDLLAVYAGAHANSESALRNFVAQEKIKLGAAGPARVDAIGTWLKATVGEAGAKAMLATCCSVAHVQAFETLMRRASAQGGTDFTQSGREGEPERGKIPGYENMSFEQRRAAQWDMASRDGRGS